MPLTNRTLSRRTSLRAYADDADWTRFRAAVSLHAHTFHSREVLSDFPSYIRRIPLVGARFDRELEARRIRDEAVDFAKGWWHPPLSPKAVFESEAAQIERRFGIDSIVSISDHDDINAGIALQQLFAVRRAPVSVEWTVPFEEGYFHLGVHNLPSADASGWFERLAAFTTAGRGAVAEILDDLHTARVLVVFNHPLWDLAGIGDRLHARRLGEFLDAHASRIDALEINGYRPRRENGLVRALSADRNLPLISGGDRHALAPNAVLNLTSATTFDEFAAEIREGHSHVVVMPEYRQHLAARILSSAADVLAFRRAYPSGWRRWTDRVSCSWKGRVLPLSHHWPRGGPLWVQSSVLVFQLLTGPLVMSLWEAALQQLDGPAPVSSIPIVG